MSTATQSPRKHDRPAPSELQSVWLVTEREIGSKLRSKAFVISTAILFILALVAVIWGGFAAQNDSGTRVAVVAQTADDVAGLDGLDIEEAASADDAQAAQAVLREALTQGDVTSFAPLRPTLAQIFKEVIQ